MEVKPNFLITIDTEGDNLWSQPDKITVENAKYLHRFQLLCEKYQLKPTYLTNYEMAICAEFVEFGSDVIRRETAEIGMHLHAWDNPPIIPLTNNDSYNQPYLIEYSDEVMRKKITYITDLLEDTFEIPMLSHRAGRWSFDYRYAKILAEKGYSVDCSVLPHTSMRQYLGDPDQKGGTDFRQCPEMAYFLDLDDISKKGNSRLLEIPMTIILSKRPFKKQLKSTLDSFFIGKKITNHLYPTLQLRPNGKNLRDLLSIVKIALSENRSYIEFMLHSSELMPGGSPTFPTEESVESLYRDLDILFDIVHKNYTGATLKEYYHRYCNEYNNYSEV
jgi:hypothetical protein